MKEILLLRHGKSSWADEPTEDFDRPLAKRGRKAAEALAGWLTEHKVRPALVLCSPARRTRETLDLIAPALGAKVPVHLEPDLYLAEVPALLMRLRRVPDDVPSVMVLAHNPGLYELASELAAHAQAVDPTDRDRLRRKFPTAAMAHFSLRIDRWIDLSIDTRPGAIKLMSFVTPAGIDDGD